MQVYSIYSDRKMLLPLEFKCSTALSRINEEEEMAKKYGKMMITALNSDTRSLFCSRAHLIQVRASVNDDLL